MINCKNWFKIAGSEPLGYCLLAFSVSLFWREIFVILKGSVILLSLFPYIIMKMSISKVYVLVELETNF